MTNKKNPVKFLLFLSFLLLPNVIGWAQIPINGFCKYESFCEIN